MDPLLDLGPSHHHCPNCGKTARLHWTPPPQRDSEWTDGWLERRDGSGVPPGWAWCPRCEGISTTVAWKRTEHFSDDPAVPETREPTADELRAHLETLLQGRLGHERTHELQVQLWWIANAKRRGSSTPQPLSEPETRNLFRVMRPPLAPGFEGGLRLIEALRELGEFEQAKAKIAEVRARLDRLERLVNQRDAMPRPWNE